MGIYNSSKGGCIKRTFSGCLSLLFLFVIVIILLTSIEFPEFDFSSGDTKKTSYTIEMDSTSNERMILTSYSWKFVGSDLSKRKYNLSFNLIEKEVQKALMLIDRIGGMSFEELGLNSSLNYADPDTRNRVVWSRIYNLVYTTSVPQLKTIAGGFNHLFATESLNDKDRLLFVVSFVQNIKYDRPGGVLDLMEPLATLAKQFGDCDTKAMLLYVLLEKMGIDCALMWSQQYKHAMLGVKISTRGDYKIFNGKKYYFLETTYPGWSIGDLPPDFKNKQFWFINEIERDESGNTYNYNLNRERNGANSNRNNKPSPAKK